MGTPDDRTKSDIDPRTMHTRVSRSTSTAVALAALAALAGCARNPAPATPAAPAVMTGERVLQMMHDRYASTWYKTLTFVQKTTVAPAQGGPARVATYYESMAIPGRLRIDTDIERGSGQLFANDSQYVVVSNAVRRSVPGHNALQVIGFDVYAQPVERTLGILRELGFPSTPVRSGSWQEREVWIVGGGPNDQHSSQRSNDKERLVFVRLLQPAPVDTTKTFEARFEGYIPVGRAWVAPVVRVFVDGKQTLLEEYDNIRTDRTLSDALFDPKRWAAAPHWARPK
jgi:hypothetical protein